MSEKLKYDSLMHDLHKVVPSLLIVDFLSTNFAVDMLPCLTVICFKGTRRWLNFNVSGG